MMVSATGLSQSHVHAKQCSAAESQTQTCTFCAEAYGFCDCCRDALLLLSSQPPKLVAGLVWLAGQLTGADKQSMVKAELAKVSATRPPHERIAAFEILQEPFSADNDTLTRSMKVRRPIVMQKYSAEVEALKKRLR